MYGNRNSPVPATPPTELRLIELFSSIQGEGVLIGRRQLFVRLADCNLNCAYCDTPFRAASTWRAEVYPGAGVFAELANPVAPALLTERVRACQQFAPLHHSLALTGGEPLLQAVALTTWLPEVAAILPVFLETNGTLPEALCAILPWLRWVSMDIKLASSSGAPTPWQTHAQFMAAAGSALCQIKMVIDAHTPDDEVVGAANLVAEVSPEVPLVLQPRTQAGRPSVTGARLLTLQAAAAAVHPATLVIPQLHPFLAVP